MGLLSSPSTDRARKLGCANVPTQRGLEILILMAKVCASGNIHLWNHHALGVGESLCLVSKRFASMRQ